MLGDDVVDLRDPEAAPGATHPRFDERVFGAAERALIGDGDFASALRWTLWAAKESAFKAARRIDPRAAFSPARFVVRLADGGGASVIRDGRRFAVRIVRRDDAVHAAAVAQPALAADLLVESARVPADDPSAAVRRFALDRLADCLPIDRARLAIAGWRKVPLLLVDGRPSPVVVSLSHHGEVIGFAALVPRRPLSDHPGGPTDGAVQDRDRELP
jgi:hypothetical protein